MTEYEQRLYDVIADWWDEVFARPRKLDKNDTIIDLVKSISEIDDAPWLDTTYDGFNEEQTLKALDKLYQENNNGMKELAEQ